MITDPFCQFPTVSSITVLPEIDSVSCCALEAVMACPFGVPKKMEQYDLMMKCNMCYDRTSIGKKPMCATVCPSGALFYDTKEEMEKMRPNSTPVNRFIFGMETVKTKVNIMMPKNSTELKVF